MTQCDVHPGPEKWAAVPGASAYEVSNRGGFRKGAQAVPARPSNRNRPQVDYTRDDGKRVTRLLYRVELEAFEGPCPPDHEACHEHDDPWHNCWPEELHWGTRPQNITERMRNYPAAPPRPKRICVMCRERPVTRGGKRCHECVMWLGERAVADYLDQGYSILDACEQLNYPSAEGLMRLAERYGGYSVPPLPGDLPQVTHGHGHGKSSRARQWLAQLLRRGDAA